MTRHPGHIPGPVAYLTSHYPRATDTFIQREVTALRALGVDVLTHSIRTTDASHHVGAEQKAEFASTFKVIDTAKAPHRLIGAHLMCLINQPGAWLRGLALSWKSAPPGLKAALWQVFYFLEAGVLAHHMRKSGVCHLHNHFSDATGSVAMIAAEIADIPYSIAVHGPGELFEPRRWRLDLKVAKSAFITTISYFARSQVMLFSDVEHWDRIGIVHCGVDPALYDMREDAVEKDSTDMLFVGRLAPEKGVRLLFEAVARAVAAVPNLRLILVGDGPDRAMLETLASEKGISDHVVFTGYLSQQDVAAELLKADIFALPSFAEGVPVSLMEAMAARIPVVAPRVAGVQELVDDGVSGFCVPPGDVDSYIARIETLATDADLRQRMGEAGRTKVMAEFASDAEAAWLKTWIVGSLAGDLPNTLRPKG